MIQESIYCKLFLNIDAAKQAQKKISSILPPKGNVRTIIVTEKQYQSMVIHIGSKSNNELIMNDRRFQEI
jgi:CRISPR-associated protein Cas2